MAETKQNNDINFKAIGAFLCGKDLTDDQKKEVEKLHKEYDEATEIKHS